MYFRPIFFKIGQRSSQWSLMTRRLTQLYLVPTAYIWAQMSLILTQVSLLSSFNYCFPWGLAPSLTHKTDCSVISVQFLQWGLGFPCLGGYLELLGPDCYPHSCDCCALLSSGFYCLDFGRMLITLVSSMSCHFNFVLVWWFEFFILFLSWLSLTSI